MTRLRYVRSNGAEGQTRSSARLAAGLLVALLLTSAVAGPAGAESSGADASGVNDDGPRLDDTGAWILPSNEPVELILGVVPGTDPALLAAEVDAAGGRVIAVHAEAVSVELDPEVAEGLGPVESVEPVVELFPTLADTRQVVRADVAHARGVGGAGRRIVIIDTGIDPNVSELSGRIVASACFVSDGSCPNGENRQIEEGAAAGVPCQGPGCQHGTQVAQAALAIAPDAELISIRVFSSGTDGLRATSAELLDALDWVHSTRTTHRPDVVNLSLGRPVAVSYDCDAQLPAVAAASRRLRDAQAPVVAAAGNSGDPFSVHMPACFSSTIGVTATTPEGDSLALYANRGSLATIAAPGEMVIGGVPVDGTSFAAPQVAGAWALARAEHPTWSTDVIEHRMRDRAFRITDPETGLQVRRLDVAALLDLAARPTPPRASGAWALTDRGAVHPRGAARHWGDPPIPSGQRVVAGAPTPSGIGYWLVTDRGRVLTGGDAGYFGDATFLPLNQPIVGMAATRTGRGYWLLAADGGVFSFGDARFHGSTGGVRLNAPVTDIARTPTGNGYWLVALDGGIFSFGDARFHGSTGNIRLNQPVVSMTHTGGNGYWLVARDGGIFSFGDAPFHGSLPGIRMNETGLRIRAGADGRGYHVLTRQGSIVPFGNARRLGGRVPLDNGEAPVDLLLLG